MNLLPMRILWCELDEQNLRVFHPTSCSNVSSCSDLMICSIRNQLVRLSQIRSMMIGSMMDCPADPDG